MFKKTLSALEFLRLRPHGEFSVQQVHIAPPKAQGLAAAQPDEASQGNDGAAVLVDRIHEVEYELRVDDGTFCRVLLTGALDVARVLTDEVVLVSSVQHRSEESVRLRGLAQTGSLQSRRVPSADVVASNSNDVLVAEHTVDDPCPQSAVAQARRGRERPAFDESRAEPFVEVVAQCDAASTGIKRQPGDGVAFDLRLERLCLALGLHPPLDGLVADAPAHLVANAL